MTPLAVALATVQLWAAVRTADPTWAVAAPQAVTLAAGKNVGLVVGVYRAKQPRVLGFGTVATPAGRRVPDGQTLFEIGSITKAFTGVLLADAAKRGEVKLDDTVNQHLPTDLAVRTRPGARPVTLLDLATHRSGLPVEPPLIGLTARDPANPYADFTRARLAALTARLTLVTPAADKEVYSNLGAGLLGHALANPADRPGFHALVQERVCAPLGLRDTTEAPTGEQRARLARGHDAAGVPTAPWDFASLEACGALRSTADDLLRFAAVNLGDTDLKVGDIWQASHAPRRGRTGLFWVTTTVPDTDVNAVWHNGGTGGYRAMLLLVPERKLAVVVLCSAARGAAVDKLAFRVAAALSAAK